MIIKRVSRRWLDNQMEKYKNINKNIIEFLELLEFSLNNNNNNNNNNDNNNDNNNNNNNHILNDDDIESELNNVIVKAINKDDIEFFKFLINHNIIKDIFTTEIEISYSHPDNNYGRVIEEYYPIIDYAYQINKCKVAKFFFDNLNDFKKEEFISSIDFNDFENKSKMLKYNKCFSTITKPYLKNIKPAAALKIMRKTKLPNNIINYILSPMLNVKTTMRKYGGNYRKTRKNRT